VSKRDGHEWVIIADGDDVGQLLDAAAAANEETVLVRTSHLIDDARDQLARWLRMHGGVVLLSAADTVVARGSGDLPDLSDAPKLRPTWSIGLGRDLSTAHAALAVAKASGKNRWVDGRAWDLGVR
jgi:hypothetical protein